MTDETSKENVFEFSLPEVSETQGGFIIDEEPLDIESTEGSISERTSTDVATDDSKYRGLISTSGESFDPSIHHSPPKETRTGNWRKKRKTQKEVEEVVSNQAYEKEAQKLAQMYGLMHQIPFGPGGKIKAQTDLIPLRDALAQYMAENGLKEVPASVAVLFTAGSYSMEVVQREENISKTKKFFGRVFNFFRKKKPGQQNQQQKQPEHEIDTTPVGERDNPPPSNGGPY